MKDELYEAILSLTGLPEWELLKKAFRDDITNYRLQIERVDSLVTLGRLQGRIDCTEAFVNLREIAQEQKKHAV